MKTIHVCMSSCPALFVDREDCFVAPNRLLRKREQLGAEEIANCELMEEVIPRGSNVNVTQ